MYQEILRSIDWPEDVLILDFETYYDKEYSLSKMSTVEYVCDRRFEFTGLGIQINDTTPVFIPGPKVPWAIKRLKKKFGRGLHNCTVVAKNCKFDFLILAEKFNLYPPYPIDIDDLARYYDSRIKHRLKDLAKRFKLPPKGKTSQFLGQYWDQMDHEAMKKYCLRDIEDEKSLLDILLPYIDNPAFELALARHTLNLYLNPMLKLDSILAIQIRDGMSKELQFDLETVSWILDYSTKKKKTVEEILRARSIFPRILQDVLPEGETVPVKRGQGKTNKDKLIPALAKDDEGFQLLLAHPDEKVRNLCKAKAACTSWPLHQSKVGHMINQTKLSDGKLRIPLKYYGAHTGRWSGTEKWNPLNLGGKGRGKPIHPLISQVRGTIMAPDGYTLLINDSRQIEARELAWIAGQNDLVEDFANGYDPYSKLATKVFGERVWNPTKEEKKTSEGKIADIRRGFGKDAILGCGYGMGTNTFFTRCRQNETIRPLFDSGEYDWDFVNGLIKTYRRTYKSIPKFWNDIEKCFRIVTKYPDKTISYFIDKPDVTLHEHIPKSGAIIRNAILTFWNENGTTIIQLPSGRRLFYHHAKCNSDGKISDEHAGLWGGALTENVIQAICRDLLCKWLFDCEEAGIKIVMHTYDELVGLVREDVAEEKLKEMTEIMRIGPDWAAGLPLDAEGMISKRYCK